MLVRARLSAPCPPIAARSHLASPLDSRRDLHAPVSDGHERRADCGAHPPFRNCPSPARARGRRGCLEALILSPERDELTRRIRIRDCFLRATRLPPPESPSDCVFDWLLLATEVPRISHPPTTA